MVILCGFHSRSDTEIFANIPQLDGATVPSPSNSKYRRKKETRTKKYNFLIEIHFIGMKLIGGKWTKFSRNVLKFSSLFSQSYRIFPSKFIKISMYLSTFVKISFFGTFSCKDFGRFCRKWTVLKNISSCSPFQTHLRNSIEKF